MQAYPVAGLARAPDFDGQTLILPGECIGNVGQLAADLLIATLGMPLVGYLESEFVQPCAGLDAYGRDGTLHLPLELYVDAANQLVVLQQRAPVLRGCQAAFAAQLADWLHASGFAQVIYLGSLDARVRTDAQISGSQLRWLATDDSLRQLGDSLGISELEAALLQDNILEAAAGQHLLPPWSLISAAEGHALPLLTVLAFATEGDNVTDAQSVADALWHPFLGVASGGDVTWRQPLSWQTVYGGHDITA